MHPLAVTTFMREGPKVCTIRFFALSMHDCIVETPSLRLICEMEPLLEVCLSPVEGKRRRSCALPESIWLSWLPSISISDCCIDGCVSSFFSTSSQKLEDKVVGTIADLSEKDWRFLLSSNPNTKEKPSPCAPYGTSWIAPVRIWCYISCASLSYKSLFLMIFKKKYLTYWVEPI